MAESLRKYDCSLLDLLEGTEESGYMGDEERVDCLLARLREAYIDAEPIGIAHRPSFTEYQFLLDSDESVARVKGFEERFAGDLKVERAEIMTFPGKRAVGIRVSPVNKRRMSLRGILESEKMTQSASPVLAALGTDDDGAPVVMNIASLPHLLLAGSCRGQADIISCLHTIILSLLLRSSSQEARLVLIGDFPEYDGIAHLLMPVIRDRDRALSALEQLKMETNRRLDRLVEMCARSIDRYNDAVGPDGERMSRIVVVVKELRDLMVNDSLCEQAEGLMMFLAQRGRTVGIHLILATQHPSADVLPGIIRANIPSRIAFAVCDPMESRMIIDETGAERMEGKGDMLYSPLAGSPLHVWGCFITPENVRCITSSLRRHDDKSVRSEERTKVIDE